MTCPATARSFYGDLSGVASNLDAALYQASCLSAPDGSAHIFSSTKHGVADPETGEKYLILRDSDPMRHHLNPEQGWELCYTILNPRHGKAVK